MLVRFLRCHLSLSFFLCPHVFLSSSLLKSVRGCCVADLSAGLRTCKKKKNKKSINPPHDRAKQLLCVLSLNDPLSRRHPRYGGFITPKEEPSEPSFRGRKWAEEMQNTNNYIQRSYAGDLFTLFLVISHQHDNFSLSGTCLYNFCLLPSLINTTG